jgi:hypothetical protein
MHVLRPYIAILTLILLGSAGNAYGQELIGEPLLAFNTVEGESDANAANASASAEKDTGLIKLEGTYQGKSIYISNPSNAYGNEFAVISVKINGKSLLGLDKTNVMVNLLGYGFGQYVSIEILYKTQGFPPPQVLNPAAIRSKSTFALLASDVTDEYLSWKTRNENSEEPFIIERDIGTGMWSDWVLVGTVKGKGSKVYNEYKFPIDHYPGVNKYRIKQRDGQYQYAYLPPIEYNSKTEPVTLAEKKVTAKLKLSTKTNFEIYDQYGRLILKGSGKTIDVTGIASGTYFIKIENKTDTFVVR